MDAAELSGKSTTVRSGKKCAAVPPIMIQHAPAACHSSTSVNTNNNNMPASPSPLKSAAVVPPPLGGASPACEDSTAAQYHSGNSAGERDVAVLATHLPPVSNNNNNCKLPLINPQGGIFSSLGPSLSPAQTAGPNSRILDLDPLQLHPPPTLKHHSADVKQESQHTGFLSCGNHSLLHHPSVSSNQMPSSSMAAAAASLQRELPNSLYLHKPLRCPNKLSPLSISASVSSGGIHQLQLPNGVIPGHLATPNPLQAQSPAYSDISSIRLTPQSPFSQGFSAGLALDGQPRHMLPKTRLKSEPAAYSAKTHLPPLSTTGYGSNGSNTDIEDAASPLNPPLHSFSPYLGSGISEVPSFPSLLSPSSPIHHLPKKRALSISPNNSDMLDFSCIRSSPNSLIAALSCNSGSNPTLTNGSSPTGSVGHLVGNLSPGGPHLQYKLQQRRVSVEHNQSSDGTTKMTITNQLTFSEHHQKNKKKVHNTKSQDDQSNLVMQNPLQQDTEQHLQVAEPMDFDSHSVKSSVTSTPSHQSQMKEDLNDPHICLWEGCGLTFDHLEDLVQHIENAHIEKGKSDDFTCLWQSCIRRRKPFNARYKLLIHMRIHSGEKPNKCTVSLVYSLIHIYSNS